MRQPIRIWPVLMLLLVDCAHRQPLVVPNQAKSINRENKELKPYAKPVQEQIQTAGSRSALVVAPREGTAAPVILPADDPIEITKLNLDAVTSGGSCYLVFKSDLAIPPVQFSCAYLAVRAKEALALQAHDEQQDKALSGLRSDLDGLKQEVLALSESV